MIGQVDNGQHLMVAFEFYSGEAGVRTKDDMVEFAYMGRAPTGLPSTGTINGEQWEAIDARTSVLDPKPTRTPRTMAVVTARKVG